MNPTSLKFLIDMFCRVSGPHNREHTDLAQSVSHFKNCKINSSVFPLFSLVEVINGNLCLICGAVEFVWVQLVSQDGMLLKGDEQRYVIPHTKCNTNTRRETKHCADTHQQAFRPQLLPHPPTPHISLSLRSNTSDSTTRSLESSTGVRQPAKSKIRRHNNRLSTVFNRSPLLRDSGSRSLGGVGDRSNPHTVADDPAELSSQMSAPGILKIFGSDICQGTNYKSVLATTRSSAKELIREALER